MKHKTNVFVANSVYFWRFVLVSLFIRFPKNNFGCYFCAELVAIAVASVLTVRSVCFGTRMLTFLSKILNVKVHVTTVKPDLVTYAISACVLFWNKRDRSALKWVLCAVGQLGARGDRRIGSVRGCDQYLAGRLDISLVQKTGVGGRRQSTVLFTMKLRV